MFYVHIPHFLDAACTGTHMRSLSLRHTVKIEILT